MTLEQVLAFVEAKEAGKRSASRLLLPLEADLVASSTYRKQSKPLTKIPPPKDQPTCTYCGIRGHGKNPPTRVRRTECPAFGTTCNHCGRDHHFERVCRGKRDSNSTSRGDAVFDALCELTPAENTKAVTLNHHIFDKPMQEWLRQRSEPQPYIRLKMSVDPEDYKRLGLPLKVPPTHSFINAMADTGCQSCLAGLSIVKKLGFSTNDLVPVQLKMHTADDRDLEILGATLLKLSGKDSKGAERYTKQIVYVTTSAERHTWIWE